MMGTVMVRTDCPARRHYLRPRTLLL